VLDATRRRVPSVAALAAASSLALLASCESGALGSIQHLPRLRRALEPYGLEVSVAPTSVASLQWRAPEADCAHVYRITVDHEPNLLHEADSVSTLVTGPSAKRRPENPPPGAWMDPDQVFTGQAYFLGLRAERHGVFRDWHLSREHAGPAAPTAACWPGTWDPIEDALALGWPRLPARLSAVDESWTGLRVEAKCNRAACIDPKTGGGGPEAHHLSCVTMSWKERLAGLYDLGGRRVALVTSEWWDGVSDESGDRIGLWSERETLISVDHGRPVWARFVLHYGYAQPTETKEYAPIVRTWTLESVDACPGSLVDLGWVPHAEARAARDDALQRFAAGDVRKPPKSTKPVE
jgi:hypothetical protein